MSGHESEREPSTSQEPKLDAGGDQKQAWHRAGKQPGALGYGRRVELEVVAEEPHYPLSCSAYGAELGAETVFQVWTGCYRLEVKRGEPNRLGLGVVHTKHVYYEGRCSCGHVTRVAPEAGLGLTRWRLVKRRTGE